MKMEVTFSGTDEQWRTANRWEAKPADQQAEETAEAWDQWIMASCVERLGGHRWWLDWDEVDGLWLHCQHCPAGVDELYPDGQDLIYGELSLDSGWVFSIDSGMVELTAPFQEWHGPVRAWVESEVHPGGPWGPAEYDAWVQVENQ